MIAICVHVGARRHACSLSAFTRWRNAICAHATHTRAAFSPVSLLIKICLQLNAHAAHKVNIEDFDVAEAEALRGKSIEVDAEPPAPGLW